MKIFFLLLILIYDFILFNACLNAINSLKRKVVLIFLHFIVSTIIGFIYYQFVNEYKIDTPAFIVCIYLSITPLFFLISKNRNKKIIGDLMNKNNANSFIDQKRTLLIFFGITLVLQFVILFNY